MAKYPLLVQQISPSFTPPLDQEPGFYENEYIYDDIEGLEEMLLDVRQSFIRNGKHLQWDQKGPEFGTWSQMGPKSQIGPKKVLILPRSPKFLRSSKMAPKKTWFSQKGLNFAFVVLFWGSLKVLNSSSCFWAHCICIQPRMFWRKN